MCVLGIRLTHCATSIDVMRTKITVYDYCFTWRLVTYVRRRTSSAPRPRHDGAGPSIDIDLFEAEIRCEASLGGRRNPAQLRNSPQLERWPVDVQSLTQTKRVAVPPQWIGWSASGPAALDAITATSNRVRTSRTRMPVIALRAKWLTQRLERAVGPSRRAGPAGVQKNSKLYSGTLTQLVQP